MMIRFRRSKKIPLYEINPDEVLLDARNLPDFDVQQFEGRIEKPISKKTIQFFSLAVLVIGILFLGRVGYVSIARGDWYLTKSEQNSFDKIPLFADRGMIYDRNQMLLAWNTDVENRDIPDRTYIAKNGFSHILGYVSYPDKDSSGRFWQTEFVGRGGVEKLYNDDLSGVNGAQVLETDVHGEIQSKNIVNPPTDGAPLNLSIDGRVQEQLYNSIVELAEKSGYTGGAGLIMDVQTGELLALTSYPEYNANILSKGEDTATINLYNKDKRKVFLNRALSGLYTPGSIVKPFLAIGALTENIISPTKQIFSSGSISIPNPYNPGQKTVFKDNKAHGWVDMRQAIAVSSNVYFYTIGGGYQGQEGLGITRMEKYFRLFGMGEKTNISLGDKDGTIPNPTWKAKNFKGDIWRIGDSYNTAIGQYGVQVTPVQMVRAVAALANNGKLLTPHIIAGQTPEVIETIPLDPSDLQVVYDGMRLVVTEGTGHYLNFPGVSVAAKTGTAQVGARNQFVNSWAIGFFPYEKPRYAFAVLMESAPNVASATGAAYAMGKTVYWMDINTPEYTEIR